MFRKFCHTILVPGTLSAAVYYKAVMPSDCTLRHVSLVQSNEGNARVKIGTSDDDDEFLTYTECGQSNTPVELEDATDFRYDTYPRIEDGDILQLYVDHDGLNGTAGQNLCIVLTFQEG